MVLDRALTLDMLDAALRIATEHRKDPAARQFLAAALKDLVTPQEAENKTKHVLARVWLAPPASARSMIEWAIEHQDQFIDRRALHYGALLATFPFFGSIAAAVGRQISIDGAADRRTVRTHARVTFGQREFIDAGASKSLRTMKNLGLIDGLHDGPIHVAARPVVPAYLSSWFLHVLILTRQVGSANVGDLSHAFELSFLELVPGAPPYPFLELHAENGRSVAVAR
jgi:hypothetical protein